MKTHRIAVYPGDGIGIDVIREAVRVLEIAQRQDGTFRLELHPFPWGCDYYDKHGQVAPEDFFEQLSGYDAIFLGALGYPQRLSDSVTLTPLVRIRQRFDQYLCVRPCRLYPGVKSVLTDPGEIDILILRENSEGEYVRCGGRFKKGTPDEIGIETSIHTRKGITRILRFGFEQARQRRKHLTMITKSNAMQYGMTLWDEVLEEIRGDYPDVKADRQHVDAAAMNLTVRPSFFDVIVATNLFGDILSDLAGGIAGGIGLAPSANINPERQFPSMFEPVHGSAPDIAGQGIANPIAAVLSGAMMLDWLGYDAAAEIIRSAVAKTLAGGIGVPQQFGKQKTVEITDAILKELEKETL
jgi:tartrate dehydrogenase/decarboxylase / D-malate dehydrogenase